MKTVFPLLLLAAAVAALSAAQPSEPLDLLVVGGRLLDRSGNPWVYADVGTRGDFSEKATFEEPHQYAAGLRYAIVNGQFAIRDGTPTRKLAGRALRRN